jgi:hypothetical protein
MASSEFMTTLIKKYAMLLSLAAIVAPAGAFIDPPLIDPSSPTAASVIDARIRTGFCDSFLTSGVFDRELEIIGQRIIIRADGIRTTDLAQCIYPAGFFRYRIGSLPAGTYDLEIYMNLLQQPGQTELVGKLTFGVAPVPQAIPLSFGGQWSMFGLLLGVALLGSARVMGCRQ